MTAVEPHPPITPASDRQRSGRAGEAGRGGAGTPDSSGECRQEPDAALTPSVKGDVGTAGQAAIAELLTYVTMLTDAVARMASAGEVEVHALLAEIVCTAANAERAAGTLELAIDAATGAAEGAAGRQGRQDDDKAGHLRGGIARQVVSDCNRTAFGKK